MLTAEQLEGIKERVEKAFPAPWHTDSENDILIENDGRLGKMIRGYDAEFVAHARQDIPALLQKIENQAKQLREQQQAIERLKESKYALSKIAEGRKQTIKNLRKQSGKAGSK